MQRSWLPSQDAAIAAVNRGNARKNQVNFFDNANSVCIGEGLQSASIKFSDEFGTFNRKGTDVTKIPNLVITRK